MPRSASGPRSSKGSMNTVVAPSVRRKADCPYHSTCMLLLEFGRAQTAWGGCDGGLGRLVLVDHAPAAQQRGAGRDQAGDDREQEGGVQPVLEGPRDEIGEERAPRERRLVVRGQAGEHVRAEQVLDRVVAQE